MTRRSYTFEFKFAILEECNRTSIPAVSRKYGISERLLRKWKLSQQLNNEEISRTAKRRSGAGRKPIIKDLEEQVLDWIIDRRADCLVVSRSDIKLFASSLYHSLYLETNDNNLNVFNAGDHWLDGFMKRNGLSLRRSSTLYKVSDTVIVQRCLSYKNFVDSAHLDNYNDRFVVAMDETAVYYGEASQTTVDVKGRSSIYIPSTGYESCRVTCILAITRNGLKLPPLLLVKGKQEKFYTINGIDIYETEKAWATQNALRWWISRHFSRVIRGNSRGMIIWDSASTHRAISMRQYLNENNIDQIMIPSGTTGYLQSLDVSINRPFKLALRNEINEYIRLRMEIDQRGNPVKPSLNEVTSWVRNSWNSIT
jgi:transposase-like protein